MRNLNYLLSLSILIVSYSCNKDANVKKEYQETRNARITQVELTDKDFRQYFFYGEDGLLDSVRREGNIEFNEASENIITVGHEFNRVRLHTIWDNEEGSYWKNAAFVHQNKKISGTSYTILLHSFMLPENQYYTEIFYSPNGWVKDYRFYMFQNEKDTLFDFKDIIYDGERLVAYTRVSKHENIFPKSFTKYTYTKQPFIPKNIIQLINNDLLNFLPVGEKSGIDWVSLVYGLVGYELPLKEKEELISQIQYTTYSKEKGGELQDSIVTFNYQVDTLNRKITFGNQRITYEFVK